MEVKYVFNTYDIIAKNFDDTRYCKWNGVVKFLNTLLPYSIIGDIGCGNGKYLNYRDDLIMIGNDTCNKLLQIINNKNNNSNIVQANGLNLPYKTNYLDGIISIAVIHHISSYKKRLEFIKELIRCIKINKQIYITVWSKEQQLKTSLCRR